MSALDVDVDTPVDIIDITKIRGKGESNAGLDWMRCMFDCNTIIMHFIV